MALIILRVSSGDSGCRRLCSPPMTSRRSALILALLCGLAAAGVARPAGAADKPLHLVLTPSQKPTDLLAAGEEFGRVLGGILGMPVRVTVASDYGSAIEALRNQTADLAFLHPAAYVLANREAKAKIVVQNQWHGKRT